MNRVTGRRVAAVDRVHSSEEQLGGTGLLGKAGTGAKGGGRSALCGGGGSQWVRGACRGLLRNY
jgi:hypothetical protein